MSTATLTDDIRASVHQRINELEPLVREYEELRRIMAVIEGRDEPATRPVPLRSRRASRMRPGRRHSGRADQAQQLIAAQPGISVADLAHKMGIGTTYLYRLLPRLEREGKLRKRQHGYHPA
jgi:hypothetical protein